ncbi:chemotaxis protein CheA [Fredinandcohnia sp. QZ13]|uniref:chemotaxis protein CheA n=1 Tax=Fredinandcohnia sp. QZ13 TaxID=3073144 RepID=UPI0028531BD5|nr:chemotaxis protein CheA [Fredinandcohnia sp. QZ13]MDR4889926.1 chemotaxis protein CheA [Fredinandcohnia sp. QZ13]
MDTGEYLELFLDESREHLQSVNDNLLLLEKDPHERKIINEIFRSAHTLKGMSATMGFQDIASLTHQMENVLDKLRNESFDVTTDVIDTMFEALKSLEEMVTDISGGREGKKDVTALVSKLEEMEKGGGHSPTSNKEQRDSHPQSEIALDQYQLSVVSQSKEQGYNVYEIKVQLTESCLLKAARIFMVFDILGQMGEVIKSNPSVEELEDEQFEQTFSVVFLSKESKDDIQNSILKVSEIERAEVSLFNTDSTKETIKQPSVEEEEPIEKDVRKLKSPSKTIRVNIERIDRLMNLFEELVIERGLIEDISDKVKNVELDEAVKHLSRISQDMQQMMLAMRMVPVEQVFNRFPRMVRELSKDLHKNIHLDISGAETELDRTVVDEIGDPLVHLLRNSIDHGIELPERRTEIGKKPEGKLLLKAYHAGNHVFIEIEDDGNGINREKVLKKAIERGLVTQEQSRELSDEEVYQLIFSSGFSTADKVSDVSGRGVGLDVVKSKIESLGGKVFVESEKGKGSKFSIQLPLTLSILSTLLVNVKKEIYAIPLSSILETLVIKNDEIMKAHHQNVIDFRGKVVPLVFLKDVFEVPNEKELVETTHAIVVVKRGEKVTGLVVDSFIGQREIVLKSLGGYLQDIHAISGATILGNGQVCLIIDPNELVK